MKNLTRQSAIIYLSLVFIAGAIAGGAAGYHYGKTAFFRRAPSSEKPAERALSFLKKEIELTEDQAPKVMVVLEKHFENMGTWMKENEQRINAFFESMNKEMEPHLTPAQIEKLNAIEKERQKKGHKRGPHGRH